MRLHHAGGSAWTALGFAALLLGAPVTEATAADTRVRLSLDRSIEGPAAPFLLALDRGYFQAEGLIVGIDAGANSLEAITRVASGLHEMAVADINTLIRFHDANPKAPVKAVFILHDRPAYAIVARRSRGIGAPRDLEGKRLGAPSADSAFAQWSIFAKANGIDPGKVVIDNVGAAVREPMLAAGQVDAITGLTYEAYLNLKDRGVPAADLVALRMADYGVELYGLAIIVNTTFAAEEPEAVRGFLRAFVKGLEQTVKSPAIAIDSVLRRNDGLRKELELERLNLVIRENIMTPEVKKNGFGAIDPARFARAIEQTAIAYRFKEDRPAVEDIFNTSYLPPLETRKPR
jgi:NitT/TauT family transport system substrate-binding protein